MSSFIKETRHPKTGEWEAAQWLDDLFGPHRYGVVFPSDIKEAGLEGLTMNGNWFEEAIKIAFDPDKTMLETRDFQQPRASAIIDWCDACNESHEYACPKKDHYDTGATRNPRAGKGRYDLLSPHALRRIAIVMEKGAEKHGDNNWKKGIPQSRLLDSAIRHLNQFHMGMIDEDHLGHALFNVMALIHFQEENRTDLQDL